MVDDAIAASAYPGLTRAEVLDVRAGDWVLLTPTRPFDVAPLVGDVWRWYRVVSADDDVIDSNSGLDPNAPPDHWIRYATLDGPDYAARESQVIVVKGVVAVFEKTIRLDTSSLWNN